MNTRYETGKHSWTYNDPIYQYGKVIRRMLGPCPRCGTATSTYGGGFNCHKDYCPNSADTFTCRTIDKWPKWWNTDIKVFLDGTAWCANNDDFVNLQESDAGFGDTPDEAVKDLIRQEEKEGKEMVDRDQNDLYELENDRKTSMSDEEAAQVESDLNKNVLSKTYSMVCGGANGDKLKANQIKEIIINSDEVLDAFITMIDDVSMQIGYAMSKTCTVEVGFAKAEKARNLAIEAIKDSVRVDLEG